MYPNLNSEPSGHLSHDSNINNNAQAQLIPLHLVWKGSNIFLFGGRFVFGPDVKSIFLTLFLILAPVILFLTRVSRGLLHAFPHYHFGQLIVAFCGLLAANTVILLLVTSGRDPGIVPRNSHPPEPDDEFDTSSISTDWAGSQGGVPTLPPTKNVIVNGMVVKVKYCRTCMLYRPPRCSHCSICNNCVERFDHHCPWVGQCIGRRNYRYFYMFVSSTTLLCLYVFAFCWVNIKKIMETNNCGFWKAVEHSPASGILIMYTFVVAWFVGGLTTFHLYLICTNQTTYENFRYRYDKKNNPYNLGCARNVMEVFFSKIPAPKVNFRERVKVDSVCVSTNSSYMCRNLSTEMPETSMDIEMGKRHSVNAVDLDDIRSHIASGRLDRCRSRAQEINCEHRDKWEISDPDSDIHILDVELESVEDRKRNSNNGGGG